MVNWGNVKTLKNTMRETINLFTLNPCKKLPEERESNSTKIIVVLEGDVHIFCQIGPAKNKTVFSAGQSVKVPAGCWYEIINNTDQYARFLVIEQESGFIS